MSTVYRAIQLDTGREVALKLISSGKPDWLAQFGREAEIIASLEHPHILPVYNFGTSDSQPYLVMRLLEGGSLSDWVKSKRKPNVDKVIKAVTNMAEALDFSHARGILHRDVKPSNMLLDQNGFVYLSDFGLAVFPADGEQRGLGSAAYISPEQARGEDVDGRADIYSLAVTLFELITGEKPYTGETPVAVMVKHINEPIPNARDVNPEVSKSVAELIQWGMSKKPENRPQSAGQFKELLQYAHRNPNAPVRPSRSDKPSKWPTMITPQPDGLAADEAAEEPSSPAQSGRSIQWPIILLAVIVLLMTFIAGLALWFVYINSDRYILPEPTAISQPTEEADSEIPTLPALNDKLIYLDRFEVDAQPGDLEDTAAFIDGALQIQPESLQSSLWFSPPQSEAEDGIFRIELLESERADRYQVGLVCRKETTAASPSFIGFFIEKLGDKQSVSSFKLENGEQTIFETADIPPQLKITDIGSQTLELRCIGNELEFFINDFRLLAGYDDAPTAGVFGVLTTNLSDEDHIARFDNVEIEKP